MNYSCPFNSYRFVEVYQKFKKEKELENARGGYRAQLKDLNFVLAVGKSHPGQS